MEDVTTLEIRRLRERVMELEAIVNKQNIVLMNEGLLAMRSQMTACRAADAAGAAVEIDAGDPCEQCGLPCDGSSCPDVLQV